MTIEFFPMDKMLATMRTELDEAFRRVLVSRRLILGPEVEAFEQEFAAYCGVGYCVGVGNGLDALAIALQARVQPGDEVIVRATHLSPAGSPYRESVGSLCRLMSTRSASTWTLIAPRLRSPHALSPSCRCILGSPAPMDEICAIAERHGLFVLEDAAQAHGGRYRSRRTGSLGHAAAFSFYPTKNLAALGDGGAIVTGDAYIAERARRYRNYGSSGKNVHDVAGANSRLDELQAAFLRARLRRLDRDNARRREIAALYLDRLAGIDGLTLPQSDGAAEHVYHLFVVRTPHRDRLAAGLASRGIGTMVHYPLPPHLQPAFAAQFAQLKLPITEVVADEVLSLPMSPVLDEVDVNRVAAAVREVIDGSGR